MPEFVRMVDVLNQELAMLEEEAVINVLVNLLKLAVERHQIYPPYVIDAVIEVLDARIFFDHSLAPGSRLDN